MDDLNTRLRRLPAVSQLLEHPRVRSLLDSKPRAEVVSAVRTALDAARAAVLGGGDVPDADSVLDDSEVELDRMGRAGMRRVVNATGIVLHTGLGRAVLPQAAIDALVAEASAYCLLALDDDTNKRGRRERFCEAILKEVTGCEGATVVNNNAAAVLLILNTLAEGKEVLVSRGQLVEIGGSYRMPDVMAAAGCKMVEVGCTNRTHLRDYANAITEETAAIIRVHPSNYRIQGFTSEVPLEDLVKLGREHGIPVIDDLGAGALVDIGGPLDEPLVSESLRVGADLVSCSADKLIGGPQGGIILGSWELVRKVELNQMSRALRVGKLDLIALEATLRLFRDKEALLRDHPTSRMLTEDVATITRRARRLATALRKAVPDATFHVADGESYAGSGALPIKSIPSKVVTFAPPEGVGASEAARRLRVGDPSLFVRVSDDRLHLDPRTIQGDENQLVTAAIATLFEEL
jgi:L-seryl-tRNA(Ser) seleniumtransferase